MLARCVPLGEAVVVAVTGLLAWITERHPLLLSPLGPWDFSWPAVLATGFGLLWFRRGLAQAPMPAWRRTTFLLGLASIYAVLLTRFEFLAQHMFFLNRVQHLVMHHFGPFLIALSWPGGTIAAGMPPLLRRCCTTAPVRHAMRVLQQPLVAIVLFEGLLVLWLVPPITFRAMFDARLYAVMNASMVVDGLLFWFLVLDPRPAPPAPAGFFIRLVLGFVIIFPQIAVGTLIGMARTDLYPSFALCGRVFPAISAIEDQQIGGMVLWVPAGMMSSIAAVLIMRRMFAHDDRMALLQPEGAVR